MGGFKQKGFMQNADTCSQSTFQFDPPGIVVDARCSGFTGTFFPVVLLEGPYSNRSAIAEHTACRPS